MSKCVLGVKITAEMYGNDDMGQLAGTDDLWSTVSADEERELDTCPGRSIIYGSLAMQHLICDKHKP